MRKFLICGNWKMHHNVEATRQTITDLAAQTKAFQHNVEVAVAPVATVLWVASSAARQTHVQLAAQNVHHAAKGAFTGEWSVSHLQELSVGMAIVGHSERRQYFGETDENVGKKVRALLDAHMTPIACVGETLSEREENRIVEVITRQMKPILQQVTPNEVSRLVIAYEPVWAIGTGKTATPLQAQEVHAFIRELLEKDFGSRAAQVRLLYGGSAKPDNAAELLCEPDIDGLLVGGASLDAASFASMVESASRTSKNSK